MLRVLILFVACLFASVASAGGYSREFRLNLGDDCHRQEFNGYGAKFRLEQNDHCHRERFVLRQVERDYDYDREDFRAEQREQQREERKLNRQLRRADRLRFFGLRRAANRVERQAIRDFKD